MKINKEKIGIFLDDNFTRVFIAAFMALIVYVISMIFIKSSFVRLVLYYVVYFLVLHVVNKIYLKIIKDGK